MDLSTSKSLAEIYYFAFVLAFEFFFGKNEIIRNSNLKLTENRNHNFLASSQYTSISAKVISSIFLPAVFAAVSRY